MQGIEDGSKICLIVLHRTVQFIAKSQINQIFALQGTLGNGSVFHSKWHFAFRQPEALSVPSFHGPNALLGPVLSQP